MNVIIDTRTGQTGDYAAWMQVFADLWRGGRSRLSDFMSVMSPDVKLSAPGLRSTVGWVEGERAFMRTFDVMPDLTAEVLRWSASGDVLFIEMKFSATIGGKRIQWPNVDRFVFRNGMAVERVAFFNPLKVRKAFLANPAGWMQLWRRIRNGL